MKTHFKAAISGILISTTALAGCSSSGGGAAALTSATGTATGGGIAPTVRPTGATISSILDQGTIKVSNHNATTALRTFGRNGSTTVGAPANVQVRKNFIGGVDVSIEGDVVSLRGTDATSDTTSWNRTGPGYSLALWNAGRGGRDGLFRDEEGQVFHKILGYRHSDTRGSMVTRGHTIIGNQTSVGAMGNLPRTLTYDGYFYANTVPGANPSQANTGRSLGGLRVIANFDNGTVAGRSTSFQTENPGDLGPTASGDTLRFTGQIRGSSYRGNIASTNAYMNGATVNGAFYGAGAQETAGTISGQNGIGFTEGYFTASDGS